MNLSSHLQHTVIIRHNRQSGWTI